MLICGIKLTHDGSVAVIDATNNKPRLLFSTEMEKLDNGARYAKITDPSVIKRVLNSEGIHVGDISAWVLDGWKHGRNDRLEVEYYHEFEHGATGDLLSSERGGELSIGGGHTIQYMSYRHMASHIIGTYVTSPWAATLEPCYALTWDGGQNPRVYYVDPEGTPSAIYVGTVMEFYGIIYSIMGYYFGPYKNEAVVNEPDIGAHNPLYGGYETPGKLMSYIALGKFDGKLYEKMSALYHRLEHNLRKNNDKAQLLGYNQNGIFEHQFMRAVYCSIDGQDDATVLYTLHMFLQRMLVQRTCALVPKGARLMFTGGSALNIKWNSALRDSQHFSHVWVPPFPNDTGTALGAAACAMVQHLGHWAMDWSVYAGPRLLRGDGLVGDGQPMSAKELGAWIAKHPDRPVVVMHGRAELGPRALGNRSILASPLLINNKVLLNEMKRREDFRPVAPICMEEHAPYVFDPGTPDPYMLFEHWVRLDWEHRVPAVVHLDKSARLQTVNQEQNPVVYDVLAGHFAHTGIPLLCNTSANFNGKGFFPDIVSALEWGRTDHVWADGVLYSKEDLL